MGRMRKLTATAGLAAMLLLSACTDYDADNRNACAGVQQADQLISEAAERRDGDALIRAGRELEAATEKGLDIATDPDLLRYLRSLDSQPSYREARDFETVLGIVLARDAITTYCDEEYGTLAQ